MASHPLPRFLSAQEPAYSQALAELRAGRKRTHWIWFIFPQLAGLGSSEMAWRYAIRDIAEARAYLAHPMLGARLIECAEAVLAVESQGGPRSAPTSAREIMGHPDDLKLRSSATLFAQVSPEGSVFHQMLEKYFQGEPDPRTLQLLGGGSAQT